MPSRGIGLPSISTRFPFQHWWYWTWPYRCATCFSGGKEGARHRYGHFDRGTGFPRKILTGGRQVTAETEPMCVFILDS
jgi:hypothetical protein